MSNYLNEFKKLSEESGYRSNKCISDGILTRNARSPDIDIVIPTLNCKDNLKICLERIRSQEYPANLNVFIVDGGSTDGTLNIASLFKCSIIQAPGIYSDGNGGAKMLGDKLCKSNFIWHIDSDNFLVGQDVALKLIEPLLEHPECQLSVPFNSSEIHTKTRTSKFAFILNKYWNNKEIKDLLIESKKGMMENNYIILKDLNYGISNCVLFRKEALEAVGFFDNDIEVLKRLKEKGLAAAALVPGARFEQNFPENFIENVKKQAKRIKFFFNMKEEKLDNYFVEGEVVKDHFGTILALKSLKYRINQYLISFKKFLYTRKKEDLFFIAEVILFILLFLYQFRTIMRFILKRRR